MSYSIVRIEGIGPKYAAMLKKAGIRTTDILLDRCRTPQDRASVAKESGLSPKLVMEFANLADLMRLSGVGEEWADLLEEAGVDTIKELKTRNAQSLYEKMIEVNEAKKLVRRVPPLVYVERWIKEAKYTEAALEY
jgi:predicted flap endonuclease-1-like 5' DNA nuclease